jgi:glycosyltransferase 2 family protein
MLKNRIKLIQLLLGCSVSIALIYFMISELNWQQFKHHFSTFRFIYLIPTTAVFLLHFTLRAWRWRFLLTKGAEKDVLLYDSIMVGNLATFILPFRAGEFIRPYMLAQCSERSFASSFVSVVIERFFDLSTVLICFALFLNIVNVDIENPLIFKGAYVFLLIAFCIFIFILASIYMPLQIRRLCSSMCRWLPKVVGYKISIFIGDFIDGALVLKSARSLFKVVLLTILIWATAFLRFWILLMAFPEMPESFLIGTALGIMVSLAVALPSAPGFVGVYEGACVIALAMFGVSSSASIAFGFTSHILEYVLIGVFGSLALYRNDLNLFKLSSSNNVSSG